MSEPITIIFGTTPAIAILVACAILVTVLAVLDHRRRGRLLKRYMSEAEAAKECRDVVNDYIRTVCKETPND